MKIQVEFIEPKKPRAKETLMASAIVGLILVILFLLLRSQLYY